MQRYKNIIHYCYRPKQPDLNKAALKKLVFASVLCATFMVMELVGGLLANSLAIATDAAHMLADLTGFMISIAALWIASKAPTRSMTFGWYRAEVLGALTSVLFIWVVTGVLLYWAINRIIADEGDINANIMLISATVGIFVNILMGAALHAGGLEHAHGHSHDATEASRRQSQVHSHCSLRKAGFESTSGEVQAAPAPEQTKQRNLNVQAAIIHVIGDFIQSIGVLIAAIVIYFEPSYHVADPLCTFLFSILVLLSTVPIAKEALTVLLEGKPPCIDFKEVLEVMTKEKGVCHVHRLRIWALSVERVIVTAHIVILPNVDGLRLMDNISNVLHSKFNIFEMTLQTERFERGVDELRRLQPKTPTYLSTVSIPGR